MGSNPKNDLTNQGARANAQLQWTLVTITPPRSRPCLNVPLAAHLSLISGSGTTALKPKNGVGGVATFLVETFLARQEGKGP
jgi:hypothetical protein